MCDPFRGAVARFGDGGVVNTELLDPPFALAGVEAAIRCRHLGCVAEHFDVAFDGRNEQGRPVGKKKHYAIARGSALECGAILDCSLVLNLINADAADRGNALLARIVSMLSKMAR